MNAYKCLVKHELWEFIYFCKFWCQSWHKNNHHGSAIVSIKHNFYITQQILGLMTISKINISLKKTHKVVWSLPRCGICETRMMIWVQWFDLQWIWNYYQSRRGRKRWYVWIRPISNATSLALCYKPDLRGKARSVMLTCEWMRGKISMLKLITV